MDTTTFNQMGLTNQNDDTVHHILKNSSPQELSKLREVNKAWDVFIKNDPKINEQKLSGISAFFYSERTLLRAASSIIQPYKDLFYKQLAIQTAMCDREGGIYPALIQDRTIQQETQHELSKIANFSL